MGAATTQMTIQAKAAKAAKAAAAGEGPAPSAVLPGEAADEEPQSRITKILDTINSTSVQSVFYVLFVVIFQELTNCLRVPDEYYIDKHVMDRLVENHFDSSHNTFESVRRIADIYEWGNNVLWPGLFSDMGPCEGVVGDPKTPKTCNDDAWPDGEGSFHVSGATPYSIEELVKRFDQFDWTDGVYIRQLRSAPVECKATHQLGKCYPDTEFIDAAGWPYSRATYGPSTAPHTWMSVEELGANPAGLRSAALSSMREFAASGYPVVVIPFFSDTYLAPQEGTHDQVTDYRKHYVNTTNGREARFYCVRTTTNGLHIKQECDPGSNGDGTGTLQGTVRRHVELMWNDLKRGHYLDAQSRVLSVVLQLRSNHVGIRYRITLMYELTSLGAILPSYDVESAVLNDDLVAATQVYANLALALVIFFSLLEFIEVAKGPLDYVQDVWNVMDWLNFVLYFFVYAQLMAVNDARDHPDCSSHMCSNVGYFDDWRYMSEYRNTKLYLSLCVCIQLLKILKFTDALVPKMSLATSVLRVAALDLLFFGFSFIISMLAFSMMLYIQLGTVMQQFQRQPSSFLALARALFGDFDVDEILNNSSGNLNLILFLIYLFVAIFIMLSMFLAILAEAQIVVREKEDKAKEDPAFKEFGVLASGWEATESFMGKAKESLGLASRASRAAIADEPFPNNKAVGATEAVRAGQPSPEPPQATVADSLREMSQEMARLQERMARLQAELGAREDSGGVTSVGTARTPASTNRTARDPPIAEARVVAEGVASLSAPRALPLNKMKKSGDSNGRAAGGGGGGGADASQRGGDELITDRPSLERRRMPAWALNADLITSNRTLEA